MVFLLFVWLIENKLYLCTLEKQILFFESDNAGNGKET